MTLQQVNLGTPPAGSDGDDPRTAFTRINQNFKVLDDTGLTGPVAVAREVANLNDASSPGKWIGTAAATNRPAGFTRSAIEVIEEVSGDLLQQATDKATGQMANRVYTASADTWSAWVVIGIGGSGGPLPIESGGTGAGTAAQARTNLGLSNAAGPFTGSTASSPGTPGLVPAPAAGDQVKFLTGAGTYAAPPSATWGQIGGALVDQADIQAVLTAQNSKISSLENLRPVAMLTFDGASATPAIISQKGIKVASISRVATGVHRLTFSSNIASAVNKILVLSCPVRTTSTFLSNFWFDASSLNYIDINTFAYSGGANTNVSPIPVIIYELP